MKATQFRRFLWRLTNRLWPTLAARLKAALLGTNRLGIQFQTEHQAVLDYVTLVQPPVWKSINVVNPEFLPKVAAANPRALGIYRAHPNSYWADDPEERAIEHVNRIAAEIYDVRQYFDIVEDNNEYVFPFDSPERIAAADRYMARFIELCSTVLGKKALVLNAATGNWGDDIGQFVRTLDALRLHGGYIGFHEYDFPTMWRTHKEDIARGGEGMWQCLRWKRAARTIKLLYGGWCPKFIISEAGIDSGAKPGETPRRGFRGVHPDDLDASVENYVSSLQWYYDHLDDDVFAVTLFGCGMTAPWDGPEGFDIKDTAVPHRISLFPTEEPPEPPEPNGGDDMIPDRVKIYDFDHGPGADDPTTSKEWLRSIFGDCINVHPVSEIHILRPGDLYYQLQWINCKPGTTSVIIELRDENGRPVVGDTVIFRWPTADPHGYADHGWNWSENGAPGDTDANGIVGPVMSKDAYYSPDRGECGVFSLWAWGHPGEMVDGVGMLPFHDLVPGANHLHTEYGFKLARWGEEEPPTPPEPPVDGKLLAAVLRLDENVAEIKSFLLKTSPEPPADTLFHGEYFNNTTLSGAPVLERDDEKIDFSWGGGSPAPEVNADDFSVRWTAKKTFEARTYTFHALTDDGFRLWVDGELLIDAWKLQAPTPYQAIKVMTAGQHDVEVVFFEDGGGATCKLSWS